MSTSAIDYRTEVSPRAVSVGRVAMMLFLASLTMLFVAGMALYLVFRLRGVPPDFLPPPRGTVVLPLGLWISTALMLLSSVTAHLALVAVRKGDFGKLRRWLLLTGGLAVAFVAVQVPSLITLLDSHAQMAGQRVLLYAIAAFLLILHAAHVLGGLIALGVTIRGAMRDSYTPDRHIMIRNTASYWHFLDAVWLVMFFTIWSLQ